MKIYSCVAKARRRSGYARTAAPVLAFLQLAAFTRASAAHECTTVERANARILFNEGLDLRKTEAGAIALTKLQAADALCSTPKTRFEVGKQFSLLGQPVEAAASLLSVPNVSVDAADESRYAAVRREAVALAESIAPQIAQLRFTVTASASGDPITLLIDGLNVPKAAWTEPRRMNPGTHTLVVRMGMQETVEQVVLTPGETRAVMLRAPLLPPAAQTTLPRGCP
jgi:hypothetical protein